MFYWLNDHIQNKGTISPFDRGFTVGDGVFTTMRWNKGHLNCFDAHFKRLTENAGVFRIQIPYSKAQIETAIQQTLDKNNLLDECAAVRITVTRGISERGLDISEDQNPTVIITVNKYEPTTFPLRARISSIIRPDQPPLCHTKHLGYQQHILAKIEVTNSGYNDAILLNTKGYMVCATTSNVFFVVNNCLITPPLNDGCLPGTMRGLILKNIPNIQVQSIHIDQLNEIQTAFISNSLIGIRPIDEIQNQELSIDHPLINQVTQFLAHHHGF